MSKITIIPYVGGKYNLIDETVPIIEWCADYYKLNSYLEVCGGGARHLLNLSPTKFKYRLYNDKDLGLCKLFKFLGDRELTSNMINKLLSIEYTEENFYKAKELYDKNNTDTVAAAAYTFLLACQSRASNMTSFDSTRIALNKEKQVSLYINRIHKLHSSHVILGGVDIKNEDGLDILEKNLYKNDCFITIDPPYITSSKKSKNKTYKHDSFNHARMVDLLLKTNMKVMLCGYANNHNYYDMLNETNGWHKIFLKNLFVSSSGKASNTAEEFIWVNFDIPNYVLNIKTYSI